MPPEKRSLVIDCSFCFLQKWKEDGRLLPQLCNCLCQELLTKCTATNGSKWLGPVYTLTEAFTWTNVNASTCLQTQTDAETNTKKTPSSSSVSVCDWLVLVSCPANGSMTSKLLLPISLTAFCPFLSGSCVGQQRHLKTIPLYSCLSHLPFMFPSSWTASAWRMKRRSEFLFFPTHLFLPILLLPNRPQS